MEYPERKETETMKRITKIEAADTAAKKLRIAAYARVSTDSDEQLISLDAQKNHYEVLIRSCRDWEYAGLYYEMCPPTMIQMHPPCTPDAP